MLRREMSFQRRREWAECRGRLAPSVSSVAAILMACLAGAVGAEPRPPASGPVDATAIVDHVDRLFRGDSSQGRLTMSIVTRSWTRTLGIEVWTEALDKALIRISSPPKEKGTATLKAGDGIWNYLPKIDRTIRVPLSLMMAPWMGSHFTNDDLIKESRFIRDYVIDTTFDGERGGLGMWEFTLTPRPEAAVVWGAIRIEVRKKDRMPIRYRYFASDGTLQRTLEFSEYQVMDGNLIPTVLTMLPSDKPGESTVLRYESLRFDVELPADTFSLAALRR